ncbi:MAG: hypothetical protein KJO35_06420, partial [Gammaproteobacteria bacterium]|nr:hypothetical protein [Gammaproteobacteria bacterium]
VRTLSESTPGKRACMASALQTVAAWLALATIINATTAIILLKIFRNLVISGSHGFFRQPTIGMVQPGTHCNRWLNRGFKALPA